MASLLWSVCTDQKIDGPDWQGDILVQHLGDGALRPLELPQWMFDRAVCCTMRLTEEPSVSCSALFELKELLRVTAVTGEPAVIQTQHHSSKPKGDADAMVNRFSSRPSAGIVSSSSENPRMENTTTRSKTESDNAVGANAAPPSLKTPRRQPLKGGKR